MRVVSIVGARPQFIKAAPLLRALAQEHDSVLIHTGQHYDAAMSDVFFDELAIPAPTHCLGVGSGSHGRQTAAMLMGLEPVLRASGADWVVVFGDTNTTLAGALAAAKCPLRVAHAEAGLRSYNRRMPEEQNRVVVDHLSTLLFCPSELAVRNLEREGITQGVHQVGDLMAESCGDAIGRARQISTVVERLGLAPGTYLLATVHRAENTDDPVRLRRIFEGLQAIGENVIVPVHPRTRLAIEVSGVPTASHVRLIDPIGYLDMLKLQSDARVVLTDSGGVQREAYWLGVPCVILRDETEWGEIISTGANVLAGVDPARIVRLTRMAAAPAITPALESPSRPSARIAQLLYEDI